MAGEKETEDVGGDIWCHNIVSRGPQRPMNDFVDTTKAHVSVIGVVSRQPSCFVHVFRVAVRETNKSCGCFFFYNM